MYTKLTGLLLAISMWTGCFSSKSMVDENPAAPGFNSAGSDAKAIAIADEVMNAMGGRQAWDQTCFLTWNFFGFRKHYWNKCTGDVRIESLRDSTIVLMNIHTKKGRVKRAGEEVTDPNKLEALLQKALEWWINDSYWLLMPFKLKDSGVTLRYLGEGPTQTGQPADILELTFEGVGVTPQNKYHVWVDKQTRLVTQWAFYRDRNNQEPDFITPWEGYQRYGKILLSSGRGQRSITEIDVPTQLPPELFSQF